MSGDKPSHLVFVNGLWYHKIEEAIGRMNFEAGPRLPNAKYLDMHDIACHHDLFPTLNSIALHHMMLPPAYFANAIDAFEIRNHNHLVIFGCKGTIFTP